MYFPPEICNLLYLLSWENKLDISNQSIVDCLQELWEDDLLQLVLTHNCTSSILQKQLQSPAGCSPPTSPAGWEMVRQLSWSCHPLTVVPVYPYILAMSLDTMEVRSQVNGTLLQTLNLPKLTFLSAKVCLTKANIEGFH